MSLEELISKNLDHFGGTFLYTLKSGYFDLRLFNEVLKELIAIKRSNILLDGMLISKFGLFAFYCIQHIYQHEGANGTSTLINRDDVNIAKVIDSLHWCLNAMIYNKDIDNTVIISSLSNEQ